MNDTNHNDKNIEKSSMVKAYIIPAIISMIVSTITGVLTYNYQKHKDYNLNEKPLLIIHDYTKELKHNLFSSNELFFNLSIRSVTIQKIILKVKINKVLELYNLSYGVGGGGGGPDESKINVASVRIDDKTKEIILIDIDSDTNKFVRKQLPVYVDFPKTFSSEFFKIKIRQSDKLQKNHLSIIYTVHATITYSDLSSQSLDLTKMVKTKSHIFHFINSADLIEAIPNNIKLITVNNLTKHKDLIERFFRRYGNHANIKFTTHKKDQYILFDSGLKLKLNDKFSTSYSLNFYKENGSM